MKKISAIIILALIAGAINSFSYAEELYPLSSLYSQNTEKTEYVYFNNLAGYKLNGLWGFKDLKNDTSHIPPIYNDAKVLNSNYIKLKKGEKWGLIDNSGKTVVPFSYDDIKAFSSGKFLVTSDGLSGITDEEGKTVIPVYYQTITKFNNNYFKVVKDGKCGLVSVADGSVVVPAAYDDIVIMKKYFKVKSGRKWGLLDHNKNTVVNVSYDDIKILNKKYFGVKNNNNWGAINAKTGSEVVPIKYERISISDSGALRVRQGGKWKTYTADLDKKTDEVKSISPSSKVFINKDRYMKIYY